MSSKFKYTSMVKDVIGDIEKKDASLRRKAGVLMRRKIRAKLNKKAISKSYEAPAKFTGNLRKGIKTETFEYNTLVGTTKPAYHAYLLEFGTRFMDKRPFLLPTFMENREAIKRILYEERV